MSSLFVTREQLEVLIKRVEVLEERVNQVTRVYGVRLDLHHDQIHSIAAEHPEIALAGTWNEVRSVDEEGNVEIHEMGQ